MALSVTENSVSFELIISQVLASLMNIQKKTFKKEESLTLTDKVHYIKEQRRFMDLSFS